MILKASYGSLSRPGNSTDFNLYFGTDVGICSIIKPQLTFNVSLDNLPYWDKLFSLETNIEKGSGAVSKDQTDVKTYFCNASFLEYQSRAWCVCYQVVGHKMQKTLPKSTCMAYSLARVTPSSTNRALLDYGDQMGACRYVQRGKTPFSTLKHTVLSN
jgi:hypothetical protein